LVHSDFEAEVGTSLLAIFAQGELSAYAKLWKEVLIVSAG
jgi:hypothetical protein